MSTYNIPKQNNRDYFKELKNIEKEIVKIYKQLSKDETITDILDNIKSDFINNNISIIEDNLSDSKLTNYKDFNSKIIKMLNIFIKILENFNNFNNDKKDLDIELDQIKKYILEKIKKDEEEKEIFLQQQELKKFINDIINSLNKEEKEELKILNFKNLKNLNENSQKILLNICIFNYYIDFFSNNNKLEISKQNKIKEAENDVNRLKKDKDLNSDKRAEYENSIEFLKKAHETNKKIYRDLFNFIKLESSEIIEKILNQVNNKKENSGEYDNFVNKFKKEIYYETIIINNSQVNDEYAKQRENNNEKIDLESRKKLLGEMKELLYKQLNKLNDILNYIVSLNKQEYTKELIAIRKLFPDYTKERENTKEKDYISNISILLLITNEETEIAKLLEKNKGDKIIIENAKNNNRKNERDRDDDYGYVKRDIYGRRVGGSYKLRGGEKKNNIYYKEKYNDILQLITYINALLVSIKGTEGIEDIENPFENKNNKELDVAGKGIASIYKNIWNDYIKETQKNKINGSTIETLKQENRLYERFKEGELDPNDVLKITFEDKIIFIGITLLIRTFTMVFIEFLIDYNVIGTIFRGIVVYSVIYIFLIILSVLIINYDSYKLRIIVNYLNLHINSSNIVLHIIMFCLLIGLILIIINNNELDSIDIDNILSYTYVYKYIYEIAEKSKNIYENPDKITTTSYLNISEKEKMKLRYRLDIITMLIFIFSSLLILVM